MNIFVVCIKQEMKKKMEDNKLLWRTIKLCPKKLEPSFISKMTMKDRQSQVKKVE